ncbi:MULTISPECIES: DUF819 family protein [Bacillus]|uniref:DUF819 family protein n=1 Tax=Bacillus TaxID=1386 RepID=UPI002244ACC3|nr:MULTISPECIES: DUF819 family protein [Bacillus]MDN5387432.1 DUF819 family protein [Bacillus sp. LB7]MEC1020339.1 DUF819 family protein [Bacillus paralicheniformis]MEC1027238.1 DUF819 family protein [Bacillus paralicheniformis]MEC1036276.1 DUF819 family protein [Bacillus paralicheniformis]MEC1051296.1 DUF819 family protein [Bacillus paralicheniformis]
MNSSLISADDAWVLWGFIAVWAAVSIYLEQRYRWAAAVSGAVLALGGSMLFTNAGILPAESPVYDAVWSYVVPLAIPLLLFQINVRKILKESGRLLMMFCISALGTAAGSVIAFFLFKQQIPHLEKIGGMISASYIGGGVNFAAMAAKFSTPGEYVSSTVVADHFMMALLFFILMGIPALKWFQKRFGVPEEAAGRKNQAEAYWKRKEMSLQDISLNIGTAFAIVVVSVKAAAFFKEHFSSDDGFQFLAFVLGDQFLLLTTLTILLTIAFPRYFERLRGTQEIGTYLIYLFFVVIGIPADLRIILMNAPLLLAFVFVVAMSNLLVSLVAGKLFRFRLEEILLACNASVGGPTTAAAMAIAKGWQGLVAPVMLVGTFGYLIGNYVGTLLGTWFSTLV